MVVIRETIKLSTLLSLGVAFLSLGLDMFRGGYMYTGIICSIIGFLIILVGIYMFERGLIEKVVKCG